jgi:gliding motility-associated-like protein
MHKPQHIWYLLSLIFLVGGIRNVVAQDYFKALDTGNDYYNQRIDRFPNDDVIIANSSLEALETGDEIGKVTLIRIDGCGNELWSKEYLYENGYLEVKDVVVSEIGEIFVFGSHYKGLAEVIFLAKFDGITGENIDFRLFDPGTVDHFSYSMDFKEGRLMIYGLLFDFNTAKLGFIAIFNENLAYLWSKQFEPFESTGEAIITSDNGFAGRSGPYLYKFDSEGNPQWTSALETGTEISTISGPIETSDGYLYEGHRNGQSFFYKMSLSGQLDWQSDLFSATDQGVTFSPLDDGTFFCTYNFLEDTYTQVAQLNLSADGSISNQKQLLVNERLITGTMEQTMTREGVLTVVGNANPIALNPVDLQDFILQFRLDDNEDACHTWEPFLDLSPNELQVTFNPIAIESIEFEMVQEDRLSIDAINFELPFWELCDQVSAPETIDVDTLINCDEEWWVTLPDSGFYWVDDPITSPRLLAEPGTYQARKQTCDAPVILNYTLTRPDCPCNVFLPNAFTPNNDGQNDLLEFYTDCTLDELSASIYDRWGNLLHQSRQQDLIWDGTSRGEKLTNGVYIVVLEYQWSDANGTKTGQVAQSVTLFR